MYGYSFVNMNMRRGGQARHVTHQLLVKFGKAMRGNI